MRRTILHYSLKRSIRRQQRFLLSLLALVQCVLLLVASMAGAEAQCFIDPITGQTRCTGPAVGWQPASRGVPADSRSLAHCRIHVGDGSAGSGTLVHVDDSTGTILTCAHLFDDGRGRIVVTFRDGTRFAALLVARDAALDLAALRIRRPAVRPLAVASALPGDGLLTACGFGSDGTFRCVRGPVTGRATAVGAPHASLTIGCAVRAGDSGGAVLDAAGRIVGVVWGLRDGTTYAMCGAPVRAFVERVTRAHNPRIAERQGSQCDCSERLRTLEASITNLQQQAAAASGTVPPHALKDYAQRSELSQSSAVQAARYQKLESKLKALAERFESVRMRVESVAKRVGQVRASGSAGDWSHLVALVAGVLGVSTPLAAGVVVARRLLARRRAQRASHVPTTEPARPIAVDSPPPAQRTVPETHYVPVEKDSFAKAHQWASEHVARKYPGATEVLQAQDSLIKQYLASS